MRKRRTSRMIASVTKFSPSTAPSAAAVAKPSDRMTIRKSIVFQPPSRGSVTVTS